MFFMLFPKFLNLLLFGPDFLILKLMKLVNVFLGLGRVKLVSGGYEWLLIDVMKVFILIELELAKLAKFFFGSFNLFLELFDALELLLKCQRLFFFNLFHQKNIIQIYYYL